MALSQGGGAGETAAPVDEDAGDFSCGGFTDIQTALVGHVPRNLWLTRLDMNLPRSALERDCALEASQDRSQVEPHVEAGQVQNHPCPESAAVAASINDDTHPIGQVPPWLFGLLVLTSWIVRKRGTHSDRSCELLG
jgi:hypothetical protein